MPPSRAIQRIVVADVQVPYVEGGAELHVKSLIAQLQRRSYAIERVVIPFRAQAKSEILAQAATWRLLELSVSNEQWSRLPIQVARSSSSATEKTALSARRNPPTSQSPDLPPIPLSRDGSERTDWRGRNRSHGTVSWSNLLAYPPRVRPEQRVVRAHCLRPSRHPV